MTLDTWGNYADIMAIPIGLIGVLLIVRQLKLALLESEREHQRRQNEMTLNAYNSVRSDLRRALRRVRKQLELEDMFATMSEQNLKNIIEDKALRDEVAKILGYINKFAVGIKYDVFSKSMVNDLAGRLFIETYRQFTPYISWVREGSDHPFYIEYEKMVQDLKEIKVDKEI